VRDAKSLREAGFRVRSGAHERDFFATGPPEERLRLFPLLVNRLALIRFSKGGKRVFTPKELLKGEAQIGRVSRRSA